jgi:hypothetical protein
VPRAERLGDAEDTELAVEEDSVDREAHEEHVDRRSRPDEQALTCREVLAAEQALHSRRDRVCDLAALADDTAALPLEPH